MMVCERILPSGPITSGSCPGWRPLAGSPSTQKSATRVPGPSRTLGNERKSGLLKIHCLAQPLENADHLEPASPVGQRRTALLDAVGKFGELEIEWLRNLDMPEPDIAGAHDQTMLRVGFEGADVGVDVLDIDPLVEDLDGGVARHVVEDQ